MNFHHNYSSFIEQILFCTAKTKLDNLFRLNLNLGKTMPYSPCKRGYIAIVRGEKMYACTLHNESRMKRIRHEGCVFRSGERDLNDLWNKDLEVDDTSFKRKNGDLGAEKPIGEGGGFEK